MRNEQMFFLDDGKKEMFTMREMENNMNSEKTYDDKAISQEDAKKHIIRILLQLSDENLEKMLIMFLPTVSQ